MLTLIVATAAVLAVTLLAALGAVLIFLIQIRSFMAETSVALDLVNEGGRRLAQRLEVMQRATQAAASELAAAET